MATPDGIERALSALSQAFVADDLGRTAAADAALLEFTDDLIAARRRGLKALNRLYADLFAEMTAALFVTVKHAAEQSGCSPAEVLSGALEHYRREET